jgi:translation initiation factor IF-1
LFFGAFSMTNPDIIRVPGEIVSTLGEAAFRVRLPNGYELVGHLTRRSRVELGPLKAGDAVTLELSPFDLSRGRITGRPTL